MILTTASLTLGSQPDSFESCTLAQEDVLDGEDFDKDFLTSLPAFVETLMSFTHCERQGGYTHLLADINVSDYLIWLKPRSEILAAHLLGTSPPTI